MSLWRRNNKRREEGFSLPSTFLWSAHLRTCKDELLNGLYNLWRIRPSHNPGCVGREEPQSRKPQRKHFQSLSCPSGASSFLFCWSDSRSSPHLYYNITTRQPPSISFSPSFTPLLISSTPLPLIKYSEGLALGHMPPPPPLYLAGSQLTGHMAHWGAQRAGVQRKDWVLKCRTGIFSWCLAVYNEPSYCFSFWKA